MEEQIIVKPESEDRVSESMSSKKQPWITNSFLALSTYYCHYVCLVNWQLNHINGWLTFSFYQ